MFEYAASYFDNADARWELTHLFLKPGSSRDDFTYRARWLGLAAQKGQHQAQALPTQTNKWRNCRRIAPKFNGC
jgi:hypothetical protein